MAYFFAFGSYLFMGLGVFAAFATRIASAQLFGVLNQRIVFGFLYVLGKAFRLVHLGSLKYGSVADPGAVR